MACTVVSGGEGVNVKIIRDIDGILSLKDEWKRLEADCFDVTYYSTFDYARDWIISGSSDMDIRPFVVCLYDGEGLRGIAPLVLEMRKKGIFSYTLLRFIGDGDFNTFLSGENKSKSVNNAAFFKAIMRNSKEWDRLYLKNVSSKNSLSKWLFQNRLYNRLFKMEIEVPYADFSGSSGFEEYKVKSGCSGQRAEKHARKIFKETGYSFKVMDGKDMDVLEIMDIHIKNQRHRREFGQVDRTSIFEENHIRNMVLRHIPGNENALCAVLESQDCQIMAYVLCFRHNDVVHCWNTAYSTKFERYHLGRVLFYEVMKHFSEDGITRRCDFGCGKYEWKFEWTFDFEVNYTLDYLRSGFNAVKVFEIFNRVKKFNFQNRI